MEFISIKTMPREAKIRLLNELGYNSDGTYIIDSEGNRVKDKYIDTEVTLSNMLIFPASIVVPDENLAERADGGIHLNKGSMVILDDNPLSVASYLEEYKSAI